MKSKLLLLLTFALNCYLLSSQVPQGFNYQAIARDASNNIIPNQAMSARITLQTTLAGGTVLYQETHSVTTNQFGLMTFVVGNGTPVTSTFSAINWQTQPVFIKTEIQYPGPGYINMGTSQLRSVPYSMLAKDLEGPVKKLGVTGTTTNLDEALFEVKNNIGQTIFAVYNEGVRVFVDDGAKGTKGGFAIGGFGTAKAPSQEYLRVTRDSTRVYVNPAVAKGNKGGFAIGGFAGVKAPVDNFLDLTKENYFIGHQSGYKNTTGKFNSFIGYQSGYNNIAGQYNTMIGFESGYSANADYNSFFGYQTGKNTTSGAGNLFMGYTAGLNNQSGWQNVFLGYNSGKFNVAGYRNTFVGSHAGYGFNTGTANIMLGSTTGNYFYGGDNNIFLGNESGFSVKFSTAIANNNVFIGTRAGKLITTGSDNAFIGTESGLNNNTGINNVFIGNRSGYSNTAGYNNIFVGYLAGENASGNTNSTFIGNEAGRNITGDDNIAIGDRAGFNSFLTTHDMYGVAILGIDAGRNLTGNYNTILGYSAGSKWGSAGSGSYNVFVGTEAGSGSTIPGDNNICIGYQAGYNQSGSNKLFIENSSAGPTAALIYGDFLTDNLKLNANVDIRNSLYIGTTSNPGSAKLYVTGNAVVTGTINGASDARYKKNIDELENVLSSVQKIRSVYYDWNIEAFPAMEFNSDKQIGFLAQEVESVFPVLVSTDSNGYKSMDYSRMSVVLLQAVKEQQSIIDSQNDKLDSALKEIDNLKNEIEAIKALIKK